MIRNEAYYNCNGVAVGKRATGVDTLFDMSVFQLSTQRRPASGDREPDTVCRVGPSPGAPMAPL